MLRADGIGCYLATNQQRRRASFMRGSLGYDQLLDGQFYSCDLGAAKPDPEFFLRILADLGLPPSQVLLVDDRQANIATARNLGLQAVHYDRSDGIGKLAAALAAR